MACSMRDFEIIEHTADAGIRAYGRSLCEVYANAARGLLDLMVRTKDVHTREKIPVEVRGDDNVELLVAWLHEIIFRFETTGLVFGKAIVEKVEEGRLKGTLHGEPFDPARHVLRHEVKAVTYHGARVEKAPEGWTAEVILDL